MKTSSWCAALAVGMMVLAKMAVGADIGTAFTYQGTLENGSGPVTDTCDFRFGLWRDPSSVLPADQVAAPQTINSVEVAGGAFGVTLDFGVGAIDGDARWLEIEVQCPGDGGFVLLAPRVEMTPAPHALRASEGVGPPNMLEVDAVNGRIGIGTSAPLQPLHVVGAIYAENPGSTPLGSNVRLGAPSGDPGVVIERGNGAGGVQKRFDIAVESDSSLEFRDTTAAIDRLVIDTTGRVGIGTNAPMEQLDVIGNVHASGTLASGNSIVIDGSSGMERIVSSEALEIHTSTGRALRIEPEMADVDAEFVAPNLLAGWTQNSVTAGVVGATISGGGASDSGNPFPNVVTDDLGTIGGGYGNRAGDNIISTNNARAATVGGGSWNVASGHKSTVGGGHNNQAAQAHATVSGGLGNSATGGSSTAGGGSNNVASGDNSTIAGGLNNISQGYASFVGGGEQCIIVGDYSTISGGGNQAIDGASATISGGTLNRALADFSTVAGGAGNHAEGLSATVGGGSSNFASGSHSSVSGGVSNLATDDGCTVAGGDNNQAGDNAGTSTDATDATVGGGSNNVASGANSTIAGGLNNISQGYASFVGGGEQCIIVGDYSTISGGGNQAIDGASATIGGGTFNRALADFSTVAGGAGNHAEGLSATVGGGSSNFASGEYSSIPGGGGNLAGGDYSLASGRRARVRDTAAVGDSDGDNGTFVWADSADVDFVSTGPNQFLIRAGGGVGINTNDPDVELEVNGGTELSLTDSTGWFMIGDQDSANLAFDTNEIQARSNAVAADLLLNPAGGNVAIRATTALAPLHIEGGTDSTVSGGGFVHIGGNAGLNISIDNNEIMARDNGAVSSLGLNVDGGDVHMVVVSGDVGIGTNTPSAKLHVVGDIVYTGTITDISDERLKENIAPVENAISKIQQLRGVYFNMSDTPEKRDVGLIAQDVQVVLPEAVRVVDPDNGYLGVAYPSVIPLLVEAIKEQDTALSVKNCKIESLDSEISNLKSEIDELKSLVKTLADRHNDGERQ